MIDTVLVDDKNGQLVPRATVPLWMSSGAAGRVFLLTLEITKIIEQESLDLSIFGSADGATWGAKSLVSYPQKFYCGQSPLLLDLTAHPGCEVCARPLGRSALGTRRGNADVRVRREAERDSAGCPARGYR